MKVNFEEVENIFNGYTIWSGNKEIFWYKKAWILLESGGLTTYHNNIERTIVIIRTFTLVMLYMEFCELVFNEYCCYDFSDWEYISKLNDFIIGQTSVKFLDEDEYLQLEDKDETFKELVFNERDKVVNCLTKNIGTGKECSVYAHMYITVIDIDNGKNEYNDVSEYEKDVDLCYDKIIDDNMSSEEEEALDWLFQGTYRLHLD